MKFHEIYVKKASGLTYKASDYGIYAVEVPHPGRPEMKEPYKNDWFDENGDDEYYGTPKYKAQEIEITCAYKGGNSGTGGIESHLSTGINAIFSGMNNTMYFMCGKWGRQKIRYVSVSPEAYKFDDGTGQSILVFKVKLKINDPVTRVEASESSSGVISFQTIGSVI